MRVGVFTPLLSRFSLEDILDKRKSKVINTVELVTGNYPGDAHCKLSMLADVSEFQSFRKTLPKHGFSISASSCHGNPLHPDPARADHDRDVGRKAIELARKLRVPLVIDFSGCPGDWFSARQPNWVTCPCPPEYLEVLNCQWEAGVTPYWTKHAAFCCVSWREDRNRNTPRIRGLQSGNPVAPALHCGACNRLQLQSQPHVLAKSRSDCRNPRPGRRNFSRARQGYPDV
jgi:hypothetical protein